MTTSMPAEFDQDSYYDTCSICGASQLFVRTKLAIRETYACRECKGLLREREQASAILARFPSPGVSTLAALTDTPAFGKASIYEPGTTGAFRRYFRLLSGYHQSDYYLESERVTATQEVPHQDLEATTYPDDTFDLVVSSDILEHVRQPQRAFRELARILKPGGLHIFTVPLQTPLRAATVARVDTSGGTDRPLLPPHYHGNGKGGRSLVYTDFGADIVDMLSETGYRAVLEQRSLPSAIASRVITVIAIRV